MTELTTHEFDEEANRRLYEQIARELFPHAGIKPEYPNTLDKRSEIGNNPEANNTDGLYPFLARFAKGERRPAHATAATYRQESHPQGKERGEWHFAEYALPGGRKVDVTAKMTREGDYLISVFTKQLDGGFEAIDFSSGGVEMIWSESHPLSDGSTYATFSYYDRNRDDPRYGEAMGRLREVASDLFFG